MKTIQTVFIRHCSKSPLIAAKFFVVSEYLNGRKGEKCLPTDRHKISITASYSTAIAHVKEFIYRETQKQSTLQEICQTWRIKWILRHSV
jgi:hypothetical protein